LIIDLRDIPYTLEFNELKFPLHYIGSGFAEDGEGMWMFAFELFVSQLFSLNPRTGKWSVLSYSWGDYMLSEGGCKNIKPNVIEKKNDLQGKGKGTDKQSVNH